MATPITPIGPAPQVPNSGDPETTFDQRYEAFNAWEKDELQPKANAMAQGVYENTVAVEAALVAGSAAAVVAVAAKVAAEAAALTSLNAPGTTAISTTNLTLSAGLKNWTIPAGKDFPQGQPIFLAYRGDASKRMAGALLTHDKATGACSGYLTPDPGAAGTYADWSMGVGVNVQTGPANFNREQRNANAAFVDTDKGKVIEYTAGGFTQTFGAIQAGWHAEVVNKSSADIGITTDGVTYKIYPFERRRLEYDGVSVTSTVLNAYYKVFTASDTWIKSPGYARYAGLPWAGAGSGAKGAAGTNPCAGGGGGGACMPFDLPASAFGATETLTVGSGGAAITTSSTPGVAGGTTSFGSLVFVYGGAGGGIGSSLANGGGGGGALSAGAASIGGLPAVQFQVESGATYRLPQGFGGAIDPVGSGSTGAGYTAYGGAGGQSPSSPSAIAAAVLQTLYGGGGGGAATSTVASTGNTTRFGGAPGAGSSAGNGGAGSAPGGGGGATITGAQSGAGARGEIRVWGVA